VPWDAQYAKLDNSKIRFGRAVDSGEKMFVMWHDCVLRGLQGRFQWLCSNTLLPGVCRVPVPHQTCVSAHVGLRCGARGRVHH